MAIQVRRGNEVDFDPSKMLPGEWAVSLDTKYVRMCFSPGICLRMATYEAFEADMAEIQSIMAEAQTIEEAVARIQTEINDTAIVVEDYAILSKSYAVGGTGTRENEDVDNAKYYYEQAKHISQGGNGLVPLGTIAFENLPTEDILTNAMYNISNDFTSDERFLDGGGILYGKGSNVFYTADGKWDVLAASDVKGVKGEVEDTYRQGNVNITKGNIGLENVDNTSDADKPISNKQQAEFDRIDGLLGNTDISAIGDGTVTGAVSEINENLKSIHEKYITTDASGTVIENTELATFLLRNISSVPVNGTKTIDYVNSAGQSGSFVVSKMSDVYFSGLYFTPFMSRPCYFTHNNGTWTWEELAKNSDLGYIDITDQFTVNSDKVRLFAYAENGMVTIDIQLGPGFNGSVNIANLNNLKYAPRITAYGFYNCTGSGADKNAYLGSYIDRVGTMYLWCDNEIAGIEHVTVLYPIQRN